METSADEILPGLWIGNKAASTDRVFLATHKVTAVFNCTKNLIFDSSVKNQYRVPLDDNLEPEEIRNMELWAPEIAYKIATEMRRVAGTGEAVLVHCHAGMQRSTTACAFFLMVLTGRPLIQVMHLIKHKRPMPSKQTDVAITNNCPM
jgi:dual specificity MAP kinase phosphatase